MANPFFKTQFLNSWSNKIICSLPRHPRIIVSELGTEAMKLVQWHFPYILLFWDASSLCSLSHRKTWRFLFVCFKFLYTTTKTTIEKSPKPVIWLNQGTTETILNVLHGITILYSLLGLPCQLCKPKNKNKIVLITIRNHHYTKE